MDYLMNDDVFGGGRLVMDEYGLFMGGGGR